MTVKRMCIIAIFSAILFALEELLTVLPNVQLTFLLVMLYASILSILDSTLIIIIHVILDNLFMQTFNPFFMVPQFLGLLIAAIFARLLRNKNEYIIGVASILASLIYCWLYLLVNIWFLHANFIEYLLADIPFEILLATSSFVSIVLLYKPLKNFIEDNITRYKITEISQL